MSYHLRHFELRLPIDNLLEHETSELSRKFTTLCCNHVISAQSDSENPPLDDLRNNSRNCVASCSLNDQPSTCISNAVVVTPSLFGISSIVRTLTLRNLQFLETNADSCAHVTELYRRVTALTSSPNFGKNLNGAGSVVYSVSMGLSCMLSVLLELNKRDTELCQTALSSVQQLIQALPPESLRQDPQSPINQYVTVLRTLCVDGCENISAMAASCLVSLSVAHGLPEIVLSSVENLLCSDKSADAMTVPENYQFYIRRIMNYMSSNSNSKRISWEEAIGCESKQVIKFSVPCDITTSPSECEELKAPNSGAVATDSSYLYALTQTGLYKLGTGLNETVVGYEYAHNAVVKASPGCWLGICRKSLYLRRAQSTRLWVIDIDTLGEIGEILLQTQTSRGKLCSDGKTFSLVTLSNDWKLQITDLDDNFLPISPSNSSSNILLPITVTLAVPQMTTCGVDLPETIRSNITTHSNRVFDQYRDLKVGKDIAFIITKNGTVQYIGKGAPVGLTDSEKWLNLAISEPVSRMTVGHDTNNTTFLTESGKAWVLQSIDSDFRLATQGSTRPIKASPSVSGLQQIIPIGSHRKTIISTAVNGSALIYVTESGRVYASGRHVMHCNADTGLVLGLEHVHIGQIALGKTHACAISRHGFLYTWGLNNMYQCGRLDTTPTHQAHSSTNVTPSHQVNSSTENRASTSGPETAVSAPPGLSMCSPGEHLWVKDVSTKCTVCGNCSAHGVKCPAQSTAITSASPQRVTNANSSKDCGPGEAGCLRCGVCRSCAARDASNVGNSLGSDGTSDTSEKSRRMVLSPARLPLTSIHGEIKAESISCGNYHSMVMTSDGLLYTFGSNCHGQLGVGDIKRRIGPQKVELPIGVRVSQIAAGANHSVVLLADGSVYTFGSSRKGQLGRVDTGEKYWHAQPSRINGIGPDEDCYATWIGAGMDYTMIHCQKNVFPSSAFEDAVVTANRTGFIVFCDKLQLAIGVKNNRENQFSFEMINMPRVTAQTGTWCLDSMYDLLWRYNWTSSNLTACSRTKSNVLIPLLKFLKSPEFWIPDVVDPDVSVSQRQLAMHMLSVLYGSLATCQANNYDKAGRNSPMSEFNNESRDLPDYQHIDRFQNYGGGWGYSGQSVEAIQFSVDKEIILCGFGLFGGRGEYLVRIKLLKLLGAEETEDANVELLAESDEVLFECGPRERAQILFPTTVTCDAGASYIAWAQLNGPSSDCGASGQQLVTSDNGVSFRFKTSAHSNNGTDINAGQIPQLLFRLPQNDQLTHKSTINAISLEVPMGFDHGVSCGLSQTINGVNPAALQLLISITKWASDRAFSLCEPNLSSELKCYDQERYVIITVMCLRMLNWYVRQIYGSSINADSASEPTEFTQQVFNFGATLLEIFASGENIVIGQTVVVILEECVRTFVDCHDILMPCAALVQHRLNTLICTGKKDNWSLVGLMESLAQCPSALVTLISDSDASIAGPYPALTRHMFKALRLQQMVSINLSNFLRFLLDICFAPSTPDNAAVVQSNLRDAASKCLGKLTQELSTISTPGSATQPVFQTSSRFRTISSLPNWDTTNGAADAIAFRVDSAGLSLQGAGIYVTNASEHHYTMEVLMNQSDEVSDSWQVLEKVTSVTKLHGSTSCNITYIRLNKPLKLYPNNLYAIRINLREGKTWSGENGVASIRASNGVQINFQPCSLSVNGTNIVRGQIPTLYYSLNQNRPKLRKDADQAQLVKWFMLLLRMTSVKLLDCLGAGMVPYNPWLFATIFGWANVFIASNPKYAMDVISAIDEVLPMVASSNGQRQTQQQPPQDVENSIPETTNSSSGSIVQTVVESEHPYRAGSVSVEKVTFHKSVKYMCLEFAKICSTTRTEDCLRVYLEASGRSNELINVGFFSGNKNWPKKFTLLPGNSLYFVFESLAGELDVASPDLAFGYQCVVSGYTEQQCEPLVRLEQEFTWLCSFACSMMIQCANSVIEALTDVDVDSHELVRRHGAILRKGFNLSHWPTVREVMNHSLPASKITTDQKFLQEFINASSGTVAGQLSRWLHADPFIDLHCCELTVDAEEYTVGRSIQLHLTLKDQYERLATSQNILVEVTVRTGSAEITFPDAENLPTLSKLKTETYQPTYLNKARYLSVTMMPAYAQYSFEEMRLGYFRDAVLRESINMAQKRDATMVGRWIPRQPGEYRIECRLDGFRIPQSVEVHVQNDTAGTLNTTEMAKPPHRLAAQMSRARQAICRPSLMTKGIRLRLAPSLSAQPVGFVPRSSVVAYIEEIENNDGTWLRLTDEASVMYCDIPNFVSQAWLMQHNKHTNTVLMDRNCDRSLEDYGSSSSAIIIQSDDIYHAVHSSKSVPMYNTPSLDSEIDNFIGGAEKFVTDGWLHNKEGVWIRLAENRMFCLAQSASGTVILDRKQSPNSANTSRIGYDEKGRPKAQVVPQMSTNNTRPIEAICPSIADASRTAFAAFIWHERLVKDAIASASYLKYHPDLSAAMPSSRPDATSLTASAPTALHPLLKLWREIDNAVQAAVAQHIILPSPTMAPVHSPRVIAANQRNTRSTINEELCELCEQVYPVPITTHMRAAHAGCGRHSAGYGYNSLGRYTSGWSGCCGDGGRGAATWYLMCHNCRGRYLRNTPSGAQQHRNRRRRAIMMSAVAERPQFVIKQNAMFLLELNASADPSSKDNSTSNCWTINLFPSQSRSTQVDQAMPSTATSMQAATNLRHQQHVATERSNQSPSSHIGSTSHLSDPGPVRRRASLAGASNQAGFLGHLPAGQAMQTSQHTRLISRAAGLTPLAELTSSPSLNLQNLTSQFDMSRSSVSLVLQQPIMSFLIQHHNLKSLRHLMQTATYRAVLFTEMFRVWNWMLRLVSSETSVADIIWHYISTMNSMDCLTESSTQGTDLSSEHPHTLLPHPWRLCLLAGPLCNRMVSEFHGLLYTVSVILRSTDVSPHLRRLCFRAWTFQLTVYEQDLLMLTCNILSTVAETLALSCSSTIHQTNLALPANFVEQSSTPCAETTSFHDVSGHTQLETSSRQAMAGSLLDGNLETFWESGDEDNNRSKTINIVWKANRVDCRLLFVYIDNHQDEQFAITQCTVFDETKLENKPNAPRRQAAWNRLDATFIGWLRFSVEKMDTISLELRGSEQHIRLRGIRVVGRTLPEPTAADMAIKPSPSHQLQFSVVQSDAFALFQTIASQVFNDEFSQQQSGTLRHQVLDMLFSRVQLQPLQTYVCTQVVAAIEKEVTALREHQKRNYSYCCGLLVMLMKICQARCAIDVFSQRPNLLVSLTELLLFSPSVVQCQVIDTIEKILGCINVKQADVKTAIQNMLVVIVKLITIQVRDRTTHTVTSSKLASSLGNAPSIWRVEKSCSSDIGRLVRKTVTDMANGEHGATWAQAVKTEIANHIMNLTTVAVENRSAQCLQSTRLWLALSGLSALLNRQWIESSPTWTAQAKKNEQVPVQMCENHDDGHTVAMVCCEVCQLALCRECYSVLHLNRRKRGHAVQVIEPSNECPEIDIHDGSTRLRLPWVLILFDCNSHNGMIEFLSPTALPQINDNNDMEGDEDVNMTAVASASANLCRFCGNSAVNQMTQVCEHTDCESLLSTACVKTHPTCGHYCGGVLNEDTCLPCLKCQDDKSLKQDADDLCVICFTDRLGAAPAVQLSCSHVFHHHCLAATLSRRWPGPRISFNFMKCPLCQTPMEHETLTDMLTPLKLIFEDVRTKARLRLGYDKMENCAAVAKEGSQFYQKPDEYAIDRYMYVMCYKCNRAYFGGEAHCQQALNSSQHNPEELVCGACSNVVGGQICARHGADYLEYKCRYCCSIAVYFCFGTTHFCGQCHDDFQRLVTIPKERLPKCPVGPTGQQLEGDICPLKVDHPPTGEECALGCGICRNISTF